MKSEQGAQILGSLKVSGGVAVGLGLLYAIFMTIRTYLTHVGAGPNPGITFALSLLYCAIPLFVVLFPVIGVITVLQNKGGAQK